MNHRNIVRRSSSIVLLAVLGIVMPACGGGGGNSGGGGGGLVATFTPANANPGANTISMGGSSSGQNFSVIVRVTDVTNFYGASFKVSFNPATAQFLGFTNVGSILLTQGSTTNIRAQLVSGNNGQVDVVATLQAPVEGIDIVGTQTLITLNFRGLALTGSNPFAFVNDASREAQTCPTPPAACTNVTGTLTWSGGTLTVSQ